ncbi:MAG TPA: DUF2336 domain-containing protein [Acetobacteraceae bacterium]
MTVAWTGAADILKAGEPLALGLTADTPLAGALGDPAARVRLAAHPGTPQHLLQHLAVDADVMVRAAVAMNRAATPALLAILTTDGDERVRALLAAKIAHLLPGLAGGEHAQAAQHIRAALAVLVEDEALRVRAAITDAVKAMPAAPRELILRLAADPALRVCDPVIRLSPLLTDADLLALLAFPPHPEAPQSVAARPGLSAHVADSVAARADSATIHALLQNRSANIQEVTLDALVERAAGQPGWHEPLVRRPTLSKAAARALSAMVAIGLVQVLSDRADLAPALATELRQRLLTRLGTEMAPGENVDDPLPALRKLHSAGALTEATLLEAARAGDLHRTTVALALASGLPLAAVERAAYLRSAKALVSLAWRAGFSMKAASVVQAVLGQLEPCDVLTALHGGAFPLTNAEMAYQIEVLASAGRA